MSACTTPAESVTDARYVHGTVCTWHGSIRKATVRTTGEPCCPHCGEPLAEFRDEHTFWHFLRSQERQGKPGLVAMMRWATGQHFDDADTLVNAYRQHMEGRN